MTWKSEITMLKFAFARKKKIWNWWKPLTISGLKSWAGSNKATLCSQCKGDLSVCSGLNKIHSDDVQFSTRLAGARSCGWIQWWKCFRPLKRWLSLAELPRELCPSPENRNTLVRLGSHVLQALSKQFGRVILGTITPHVKHPSFKSPAMLPRTATTFFLRGSMTRTFLSLQAVQRRLPLRLQLTLKITSGCMSSRLIMASPVPTFQMTIWLSHPKTDTCSTAWLHAALCPSLF